MKTSELIGPQLDWAVAKCNGYDEGWLQRQLSNPYPETRAIPAASTDWLFGGPIIESENISVGHQGHLGVPPDSLWYATNRIEACGFGPTPLIAAMRCFVASELGSEVDIPKELL